jgi:hypothetical protein
MISRFSVPRTSAVVRMCLQEFIDELLVDCG